MSTSEWTPAGLSQQQVSSDRDRVFHARNLSASWSLLAHWLSRTATFANRRPTRPPLSRSPGFHRASGNIRLSDCSPCIASRRSVIPAPPGNTSSPPGVKIFRTVPFANTLVRRRLRRSAGSTCPVFGRPIHRGAARPGTSPSDSTSRWTPPSEASISSDRFQGLAYHSPRPVRHYPHF